MVTDDFALKGVDVAIEALVDAHEWSLDVVGRGDEESYRARARELGVDDRVNFHRVLSRILVRSTGRRRVFSASPVTIFSASTSSKRPCRDAR
jgi:glycosyltransferase involved in cell wall biosynthesis